jgi:hypothetical protein
LQELAKFFKRGILWLDSIIYLRDLLSCFQ